MANIKYFIIITQQVTGIEDKLFSCDSTSKIDLCYTVKYDDMIIFLN